VDNKKQIGDMYLAAALLAYGADLQEVDRTDSRRQKFCFAGKVLNVFILNPDLSPDKLPEISIEEFETLFISKKLMFPASYPDAIRRIKSAIYSE
jgi:hypothetical protein